VRELEAVVRIHTESRRIYGSPKITRELPKLGLAAHAPSPDLLERDFTADGPNKEWLCDITYIATDEGFLYLAGIDGRVEPK
jgi:transposase InsO family protein